MTFSFDIMPLRISIIYNDHIICSIDKSWLFYMDEYVLHRWVNNSVDKIKIDGVDEI